MPIELPLVDNFKIPSLGWTLVDRRRLARRASNICGDLWMKHVTALMNRNTSLDTLDICGASPIKHDRDMERFRVVQRDQPNRKLREFIDDGGFIDDATDCDPRLPQLFFCVRDSSGWIGGVPASNMQVETRDQTGITASAFFFNGVPAAPGMDIPETWKLLFRAILNRSMTLANGRTLDILQYNLEARPATRRRLKNDPEIVKFVQSMRDSFDVGGDLNNTAGTITFRRRPRIAPRPARAR